MQLIARALSATGIAADTVRQRFHLEELPHGHFADMIYITRALAPVDRAVMGLTPAPTLASLLAGYSP